MTQPRRAAKRPPDLVLIEKFQCPGCVSGSDTDCGSFRRNGTPGAGISCDAHVAGTTVFPGGTFYLGLPKGFCKVGPLAAGHTNNIRLWMPGTHPDWDNCNVAVWAMEVDGFLFVRTFLPRLNLSYIDVIEGGERAVLAPNALDVRTFIDEID